MKFGDRLKQERKGRGITLDAIRNETHIAKRYLDALERSDVEALPGGIFNRGYIRSYAEFVGIDPQPILDAYDEAERKVRLHEADEDQVLQQLSFQAQREDTPRRRRGPLSPWASALALLVLALLVGGVWLLLPDGAGENEHGGQSSSSPPPSEAERELPSPVVELPAPDRGSGETAREQPGPTVDAGEPEASPLTVTESGFGTGIVEHALTGRANRFAEGTRVFFWTRVLDGEKGVILRHVWKLEGEIVMNSELVIGGPHWRTYSSYTLPPGSTGEWTVEAIGPEGQVLSRKEFECFDSPDLETGVWRGQLARSR